MISTKQRYEVRQSTLELLANLRDFSNKSDAEIASHAQVCLGHTLDAAAPELRRVGAMAKAAIRGRLTLAATDELLAALDDAASTLLLRSTPPQFVSAILRSSCITFSSFAIALDHIPPVDAAVRAAERTAEGWAKRESWSKSTREHIRRAVVLAISEQIGEELFADFLESREAAQTEEIAELLR